jgi:hypothetical protein
MTLMISITMDGLGPFLVAILETSYYDQIVFQPSNGNQVLKRSSGVYEF